MKETLAVLVWVLGVGAVLPLQEQAPPDVSAKDPLVDLIREAMRSPEREEVWNLLLNSLPAVSESAVGGGEWGRPRAFLLSMAKEDPRADTKRDILGSEEDGQGLMGMVWGVGALKGIWVVGAVAAWAAFGLLRRGGERTRRLRAPRKVGGEKDKLRVPGNGASSSRNRSLADHLGGGDPRRGKDGRIGPGQGTGERSWSFAVALCRSGLPTHEVSRRTGLAQDALKVWFALRGASRPPEKVSEGGR